MWLPQAQKGRDILALSIPRQYLLPPSKLPPASLQNVANFPAHSGLSPKELHITSLSAVQLVREMDGRLSAEEVVTAFIKRAVIGHQLLNFATEFMTDTALERARELDEYYRRTGKLIGPLHGVPISVKEHIQMKDLTCNAGFVAWASHIAPETALILQLLHSAGAIFHVRTNQPQSLMHLDCWNNITGQTLNPYNRALTPGGSSGGEGASVGFKCAPIGIGTDIGGSIRVPAAFCGAFGFRPTALRNPVKGIRVPNDGQESIRGVVGPLAGCVADLELVQSVILDQRPWEREASLVPLEWRRVRARREMTVGVLWDDGIVHPYPAVTRALEHVKSKLVAAGVRVVDWMPYKHDHGWDIISALYFPDGANSELTPLTSSGEPIHHLTNHAFSYSRSTPLSIAENWSLNDQRDIYRDEYQTLMQEKGVDFILSPVYPGPGAVIGEAEYWNYTAIWNVLDHPAVSFPSGLFVDPALDADPAYKTYKARNAIEEREWRKYSPDRYLGAPIAVQVSGPRFRDEETLAAAGFVADVLSGERSKL